MTITSYVGDVRGKRRIYSQIHHHSFVKTSLMPGLPKKHYCVYCGMTLEGNRGRNRFIRPLIQLHKQ